MNAATQYSGQQQAIGAFVVVCVLMMLTRQYRRLGVLVLAAGFVVGVLIDLKYPGTIDGATK